MVRSVLRAEGHDAWAVGHEDRALEAFREINPDVVLLEARLPGMNGFAVCRAIRAESQTPVIFLAARTDTAAVVAGLEAGADDFMAKPPRLSELRARIRVRLRAGIGLAWILTLSDLVIDLNGRTVSRAGRPLRLTPIECDLLAVLARRPGQVLSRRALLEQVWGGDAPFDGRTVNVHVLRLRAKIEPDPRHPVYITAVRGVGYRSDDPTRSSCIEENPS
ncbi:hypothetical protein BIV57_00995 [Mangrovactinospora gilvigrisea]|uniref:DNA-binding response regulator n=1 Tax=Mangrovactinospora gilvigrisea TaxID=1428644 RepID=A0A1J7BL61_9ACTN|nr:response regulator transcription factor [Mangrovactinospora gilvigrisea]OIV39443.1 hypothetical protein BIV57_00995 [Mangrovactinospora gilvigrisea]